MKRPAAIWDYDVRRLNPKDPKIARWYTERVIRFADWDKLDKHTLKKRLPLLTINPYVKRILTAALAGKAPGRARARAHR